MQNRTERLILSVGLLVGVLVAGYVFSLFTAARQADAQADANSARLAQSLIRDYEANFSEFMSRLIVSDAAFDAVASGNQARFFAKACKGDRFLTHISNFGLLSQGKIEFLCNYGDVKAPAEHAYLADEIGSFADFLVAKTSAVQDRYQLVLSEYVHTIDYVKIDERPYLVVSALVSPEINRDKASTFEPVVAFAMVSLDRTITARYPEKLSLGNFRVVGKRDVASERYSTPISSRSGTPVAFLVWDGSQQFQDLLMKLLPSIVIVTLISVLLVIRYLREIGKLQRIISAKEAEARHLSLHDALTELPNRAHFSTVLRQAISEATTQAPCFVGFLDLDYFKQVNDTYGHDTGDALIKEAARRVQIRLGENDLLARLGGDEFAFVLRSCSTNAKVREFCQELIEAIKQPFIVNGDVIDPSASLGVAASPKDGTDADGLLKAADIALYAAKHLGRGRFSMYEDAETMATAAAE